MLRRRNVRSASSPRSSLLSQFSPVAVFVDSLLTSNRALASMPLARPWSTFVDSMTCLYAFMLVLFLAPACNFVAALRRLQRRAVDGVRNSVASELTPTRFKNTLSHLSSSPLVMSSLILSHLSLASIILIALCPFVAARFLLFTSLALLSLHSSNLLSIILILVWILTAAVKFLSFMAAVKNFRAKKALIADWMTPAVRVVNIAVHGLAFARLELTPQTTPPHLLLSCASRRWRPGCPLGRPF